MKMSDRSPVYRVVCNQPLRPTQPPILRGTRNEYRTRGSGCALLPGR